MRKRILSLLLAVWLTVTVCVPALASPGDNAGDALFPALPMMETDDTPNPELSVGEPPETEDTPNPELEADLSPEPSPADPSPTGTPSGEASGATAEPALQTPDGGTDPGMEPEKKPAESSEPEQTVSPEPEATGEPAVPEDEPPLAVPPEEEQPVPGAYVGFAGIYQEMRVAEKTVAEGNGCFLLADSASAGPAVFLPRDLEDGSFAFENRASGKRLTVPGAGQALGESGSGGPEEAVQGNENAWHWVLESAGEQEAYYLRGMDDLYLGVSADGVLTAVSAEEKALVQFLPRYSESPLYLLSLHPGYALLTEEEQDLLTTAYERAAYDGESPDLSPRAMIDGVYREVAAATEDPDSCARRLREVLQSWALPFQQTAVNDIPEPEKPQDGAYVGFSGIYQKIYVNSLLLCSAGNGYSLLAGADAASADGQAVEFLPRDMGDGSYAFENRLSEKRIAAAPEGAALAETVYDIRGDGTGGGYTGLNDCTQHWIRETVSETQRQYKLKSMENGLYMGVSEEGNLAAVPQEQAAVITFVPQYNDSPLYQLSVNGGFASLRDEQKDRLIAVYESVAADVFEQNYNYNKEKSTPRAIIDSYLSHPEDLASYLTVDNAYLTPNAFRYGAVLEKGLPGTEGVTARYDDWEEQQVRPDKTNRFKVKCRVYSADGSEEQWFHVYVYNAEDQRNNAKTLLEVLPLIPYPLRKDINSVSCLPQDSNGSAYMTDQDNITIKMDRTESVNSMLRQLVHELGHVLDHTSAKHFGVSQHKYSSAPEWSVAWGSDIFRPSLYGDKMVEDFAEFCLLYFSAFANRDWQQAVRILFPARFQVFEKLRAEMLDNYSPWGGNSAPQMVPVDSVTVQPDILTLTVGESADLTVTILPENATNKSFEWSVTPEGIVSVDESGHVTAEAPGSATITAHTVNNLTDSCLVTVSQEPTPSPAPEISSQPEEAPTPTVEPAGPSDTPEPAPTEALTPSPTGPNTPGMETPTPETATPAPVLPTKTSAPTQEPSDTAVPEDTLPPSAPVTSDPFVTPTAPVSPLPGNLQVQATSAPEAPAVFLPEEEYAVLADAVLTEKEKDLVRQGEQVRIELVVTATDATEAEQSQVNACIRDNCPEFVPGPSLDISLFKAVGQSEPVQIRATDNTQVTVTIAVPEPLRADGRVFKVIRLHDGNTTVLDDLDNRPDTITIATSLFSTYVIAYADGLETPPVPVASATSEATAMPTALPVAPDTGDSTQEDIYVLILALCLSGLGAISLIGRQKKGRGKPIK